MNTVKEEIRLNERDKQNISWNKWGPYLSERQWGTVREDYSDNGDAWNFFPHEHARSRAYRWGEDGIAGISDDKQTLCFAVALWNGRDPILKERLFGLTNPQGNHGEDVKEYYFYLDSTPTHSYMKYLYKYPQEAFPYEDLVSQNARRSRQELEYELLDTGVFDQDRYFDVFVEYAKSSPDDILIAITVHNRRNSSAALDLLPTVWFRNTWSWSTGEHKPLLKALHADGGGIIQATHPALGERYLYCENAGRLLFTENETNNQRLFNVKNDSPYVKDGINDYIVNGAVHAVNPGNRGTKASALYHMEIGAGQSKTVRLRLTAAPPPAHQQAFPFGRDFDDTFQSRKDEADEFYRDLLPAGIPADEASVMRQALAGMLWGKQYYLYNVERWLKGDGFPPPPGHRQSRNSDWFHMSCDDIISMPDKWEYPWFAAWDLGIQAVTLALVDTEFAKNQLLTLTRALYMHPEGQLPAYEWNFGDVNPPIHSWAAWRVYILEQRKHGKGDKQFLKRIFNKMLMYFTWWVNRKDATGRNIFEGGFLGMDNIGVFDRNMKLPEGIRLEQADGTSWMAFFCLNMMEISIELSKDDPSYLDMVYKFYQHFLFIALAMNGGGEKGSRLWDDGDGFFYDTLRASDGRSLQLKVRSLVGLLPLAATVIMTPDEMARVSGIRPAIQWFFRNHPHLVGLIANMDKPGQEGRYLLSVLNEDKLRRILGRLLDENEFLSGFGIRSLSRFHRDHPYEFNARGQYFRIDYEPAESSSGMFGGNSNWRGPIWFPLNLILVEALLKLHLYYGDGFKMEYPTGSGRMMDLRSIAGELSGRLVRIFTKNEKQGGRRPVYGGDRKFQEDPYWRDLILFFEYFHGDIGAGIGASHQTGWTGAVALFMNLYSDAWQYKTKPEAEPAAVR